MIFFWISPKKGNLFHIVWLVVATKQIGGRKQISSFNLPTIKMDVSSSSSVIELKAELLKKQQQFEREKITGQKEPLKVFWRFENGVQNCLEESRGIEEKDSKRIKEVKGQ